MKQLWVALAVLAVLSSCASDGGSGAPAASSPPPVEGHHLTVTAPAPREWRTEVWRDVQLEVPSGWVLGYAPMPEGDGALACGVGPLEFSGLEDRPYVGRPGYGSDVCVRTDLEELGLDRAGVWFGSPLPVGEAIAKTGLHQVTVESGSNRVTVASKDEAVLRRVLGSVGRVDEDSHGCPAAPEVERSYPDEGYGEVTSFAVCVYERRGSWERMWATSLPTSRADQLVDAVESARPGSACRDDDGGQLVLLRMTTDDPMGDEPLLRDLLVRPGGCRAVQQGGPIGTSWLRLTPELVRPWVVPGVSTYVWSNGLPRPVARLFRSMWG